MADKESSELPVLAAVVSTYGIVILDDTDTSSQPESGPGGTLKTIPWSVILNALRTGTQDFSGASSLLVPVPTLDTQAARHGTSVKVAGDTMTGDLTMTKSNGYPIIQLQPGASGAAYIKFLDSNGVQRFALTRNNIDGSFALAEYDSGGTYLRHLINYNASVNRLILGTGGAATTVEVPAISAASQAAQVTAYDAALGRLAIGGVEMGDTGWRDITGELINGWDSPNTGLSIRRVGSIVMFEGQLDGTSKTDDQFWTAPLGWKPVGANMTVPVGGSTRTEGFGMLYGSSANGSNLNVISLGAITTAIYRTDGVMFATSDVWPTSLPGT